MMHLRSLSCLFVLLSCWLNLNACTYTAAVSQTNYPSYRQKRVEASIKKYIVLGFNFDNEEVYQLTGKLQDKCPNGDVRGILTKDLRTLYFSIFFWARETVASGYCVPRGRLAALEDGEIVADSSLQSAETEEETSSADESIDESSVPIE